jgi:hypothetical protein
MWSDHTSIIWRKEISSFSLMTTQERQIYFLKEKSEALKIFKKFKVMVEKRTCYYIKPLQSDRYGEYLLTAFTNFCKEEGIKRILMAPY